MEFGGRVAPGDLPSRAYPVPTPTPTPTLSYAQAHTAQVRWLDSPVPNAKVMVKAGAPKQRVVVLVRVHQIFTVTISLRAKLPSRVGGGPEA